jgi:hypothetical protein
MVRAILDGRKTQTRRVVRTHPPFPTRGWLGSFWDALQGLWLWEERWESMNNSGRGSEFVGHAKCPYGMPGDRLYVREAWAQVGTLDPPYTVYRATYPNDLPLRLENVPDDIRSAGYRWRPSIHMPRELSRLTLEITDVRLERLQQITGEDVLAEGVDNGKSNPAMGERWHAMQRMAFASLWDSINAGRGFSWNVNPWVWAITFCQVKSNASRRCCGPF